MTNTNDQAFMQAVMSAIKATYEQGTAGLHSPDKDDCAYRGYNGTKCIVGQMIKDEYYDESIEDSYVSDFVVLSAVEESLGFGLSSKQVDLLETLQSVHDSTASNMVHAGDDFCDSLEKDIEFQIEEGDLPAWIREAGKL